MTIPKFIVDDSPLTLKQILFIYEIPIFFVCTNCAGEYFLVYCSDIDELEYSIVQTSSNLLLKMLDNKIAMSQIFLLASQKWRVYAKDFNNPTIAECVQTYNKDDLPKKDALYGNVDNCVEEFYEQLKKDASSSFTQASIIKTFFTNCIEKTVQGYIYSDWENTSSLHLYKKFFFSSISYNREVAHA